ALWEGVPSSVRHHIEAGRLGQVSENPKPGEALFERVQNVIVASNDLAAQAAERTARELGFHTLLLTTFVEGEAREVAKVFAALAKEELASGRPIPRPACIIAGGETTVTVRGHGKGGRNQEMALAGAIQMAGLRDAALVCLATDGTDGPTDAAGALAEGETLQRARSLGLDARAFLAENNAYPFFAALGDLLLTGPTNTNVNDLTFVFVW
ncbi:MAG: glycerate kinase, partial [Chloroflexi bacterium]|nr:glycerate kinase [Chloroflexota bacterium]